MFVINGAIIYEYQNKIAMVMNKWKESTSRLILKSVQLEFIEGCRIKKAYQY